MKQVQSFAPDEGLRFLIRDYSFRCVSLEEPSYIPSTKGNLLDIPIHEIMPMREKNGEEILINGAFLVGIQTRYNRDIQLRPGLCMWAIQFEPYAAPFLYGISAEGWADAVFDYSGHEATVQLHADLSKVSDPAEAPAILNRYFYSLLKGKSENEIQKLHGLRAILAEFDQSEAETGLAELLAANELSERSLERSFRQYLGLSPKEYLRHLRFLKLIQINPELNRSGTDLTYELGYFDQSHFIREFKHFTGMTPGAYAQSLKPIAELTY